MMKRIITFSSVAVLMSLAGLSGCADPDQIDRVQPDLIKKSDLDGEWYSLGTILRAPYASHSVFPGLQGTLDRGVWEIELKNLYFYRTYEFVEGIESQGIKGDTDTPLLDKDGNPVTYDKTFPDGSVHKVTRYVFRSSPLKRYAITGHYDVRKTYNPVTGKESNVRVEDSSEKYWQTREYMRVDFGANSTTNFGDIDFGSDDTTIYEGQEGPEGLNLRVQNDGKYMDFVVRGFMEAPRMFYAGYGWVPQCLFYASYMGSYSECDEEEVHIRQSFMKVRDDNTYVPMAYDDNMLNKFGFYRSERAKQDELFNLTFSDAIRNIRRFRIWKEYVKNADGTLNYAAMEPSPVVYYLSEDFPRELIGGAIDLADQWNEPLMETVEARLGHQFNGRMFVLCENNQAEVDAVKAANPNATLASTDPQYCKDMDAPKYFGDLRYNLLVSVNDPVQYGLYGYGPMNSDPITGETIHANAFNYTANMRQGARTAVDMIEYEAGVQNFQDITQARHITTAVAARQLRGTQALPRTGTAMGGIFGAPLTEAAAMTDFAISPDVAMDLSTNGLHTVDTDIATARMNRLLKTHDFDALWLNADMAAVVGMPITSLDQDFSKGEGGRFLDNIVNPAKLGSEPVLKWKMQQDLERGRHAICMKEFFDDSFRGLALEYKFEYDTAVCDGLKAQMDDGADFVFNFGAFNEPGVSCANNPKVCGANQVCQFLDQGEVQGNYCMTPCSAGAILDQLRKEIRRANEISQFQYWDPNALYTDTKDGRVAASQLAARKIVEAKREEVFLKVYDRIWSTVAMHEVGHNVGLRHNFASSTDALNYFPEYWDLKGRVENGSWQPYTLWTPDTDTQVKSKLREYQQTSIMEYTGAFNARFQGLGEYDRAAILMGYGGLVEVFENPPAFSQWGQYLADPSDTDPTAFTLSQRREQPLARALAKVHHTNFPNVFGSVDNMQARKLVDVMEPADTSKPCDQHDNPYDWTVCGVEGSFCQPYPTGFFCTKPGVVEVPFRFCSDEYNWTSPTCQTWDEGTDVYEVVENSLADYEAYWPFRAYKRDNDLFEPSSSYWNSVVYNMYGWRKQFEHWAYDFARYNNGDWWENKFGVPWQKDINGGLGQTLAMMDLFSSLANIFGRPNDAYYGFNEQRKFYEPVVDNGRNTYCNLFQVREDQGARPMYPSYDFSGYLYTPARAGTFYDRLAALMYMTYPRTMFTVGVDQTFNMRKFRINFATMWPQRMQNLLSGLLTGDPNFYGWCIEHNTNDTPADSGMCQADPVRVKPRMWFGTKDELDAYYKNCKPLNPEPEYDFPTTQYRIPALAAIYGYAWMSGTFDRSFIDRNRLWLKGDGTDIVLPPGFATVEYTDPFSGKVYVASYDPAEEDPTTPVSPREAVPATDFAPEQHAYWSAARLVSIANKALASYGGNLSALSSDYQYSLLQQTVGRLEILRGLYRLFDFNF